MNPTLTYIFGEPGVGKSTLLAYLTRGLNHQDVDKPFAHRIYFLEYHNVAEIGKRREGFPGTDALSMSVQPKAVDWIREQHPWLVVAEGDRLANMKFFKAVTELGYDVRPILLYGEAVAEIQRRVRGSKQDPTWVAGRRRKAYNLASASGALKVAAGPLAQVERQLMTAGNPVIEALVTGRTIHDTGH